MPEGIYNIVSVTQINKVKPGAEMMRLKIEHALTSMNPLPLLPLQPSPNSLLLVSVKLHLANSFGPLYCSLLYKCTSVFES